MLSASHSGDVDALKSLLDQGRRPDLKDNHGWTSLHHAVVRGHLECVEYLLEHTLQEYRLTNMQTHEGETALFLACKDKNISLDIVKTLIKSDPSSVKISNNESQTPLHIACSIENSAVVELLVNANADLDAHDYNKNTPLHVAAEVGSLDCLTILLYAGADTSAKDVCGMNALYSAVTKQNILCAKMLLEFVCIDQIMTGTDNPTLLMFAAQAHQKELLEILLSKGADPHIQHIGGMLAVDFALEDYDCVEVLLKGMDRNRFAYLDRRIGIYTHTSIEIAKLTCEIFPELFAPFAIEHIFNHWKESKEDCIHIIQMLLSQLNFEYLFCNIGTRIHIGTPKLFADFLDLLDNIIFYGHDIIVGLEKNSKEWRYRSKYFIYLDGPLNVWFVRAICCVNPLYSPKLLMQYREKSVFKSFMHCKSDIPPSWELEFTSDGKVEERVHSLKHLCRCQLRQTCCKNGIVFYKQFQQTLKKLNLPLSLQLYLQYLEGCG